MQRGEDEPIDIIPPEKIAFIAYNIGVRFNCKWENQW